jgi:hypothetical protein
LEAATLEIEAPVIDQRGDTAVTDRLCLEGGDVLVRMVANNAVVGADVLVAGSAVDVRADFIGASEVRYTSTGDLISRQPSRLEDVPLVEVEAAAALDLHGDFHEIDQLSLSAGEFTCRADSTLDASGLVSVSATNLILNCTVAGNDEVSITTATYATSRSTDLSGNTICNLSGVHESGPVPTGCPTTP